MTMRGNHDRATLRPAFAKRSTPASTCRRSTWPAARNPVPRPPGNPLPRRPRLGAHGRDRRGGKGAGGDRPRCARQRPAGRRGVEPGWPDREGALRRHSRQVERRRARISQCRAIETTSHAHAISPAMHSPPSMRRPWRCWRATRRGRRTLAQQALSALTPEGDHWHRATAGEALLAARSRRRGPRPLRRCLSPGRQPLRRRRVDAAAIAADRYARRRRACQCAAGAAGHRVLRTHDRPAGTQPPRAFPRHIESRVAAALRERSRRSDRPSAMRRRRAAPTSSSSRRCRTRAYRRRSSCRSRRRISWSPAFALRAMAGPALRARDRACDARHRSPPRRPSTATTCCSSTRRT